MATLGKQVFNIVQKCSYISNKRILVASPLSCCLNQKRFARVKTPDTYYRFIVEPRQPITDLAIHKLVYDATDPAPFFRDARVQAALKHLTGYDTSKVFRHRKNKVIDRPKYEFLTDEQLEIAMKEAKDHGKRILKMPPVVSVRRDSDEITHCDPALDGLMSSKLVITDISETTCDSKRLVLVRETDGTLHPASMEQRHRMNCIYNPRADRHMHMPQLFSMGRLKDALAQKHYEFVLDKACAQMEPYEETFQSVQAITFETINNEHDYDMLLSTRHYGPMVFFLLWNKMLDGLLVNMIQAERMSEVGMLLQLHPIIHSDSSIPYEGDHTPEQLLQIYLQKECSETSSVELAFQVYQDLQKNKAQYTQEVLKAHGAPST